MKHLLIGGLSGFGILYIAGLNVNNPAFGYPVTVVTVIVWTTVIIQDLRGARK
jgi:FtsH-binding integral membrane protein